MCQLFPRREKGREEGGREEACWSRRFPEEKGTLPLSCIYFPDLYSDSGFLLITLKKKSHPLHLKTGKPRDGDTWMAVAGCFVFFYASLQT